MNMLPGLVTITGRAWRVLLPWTRCHAGGGCTRHGRIVALTYPPAVAIPKLLSLASSCSHEHPYR